MEQQKLPLLQVIAGYCDDQQDFCDRANQAKHPPIEEAAYQTQEGDCRKKRALARRAMTPLICSGRLPASHNPQPEAMPPRLIPSKMTKTWRPLSPVIAAPARRLRTSVNGVNGGSLVICEAATSPATTGPAYGATPPRAGSVPHSCPWTGPHLLKPVKAGVR